MPRKKIDNGHILEESFNRRVRDAITPNRIREFSRKICIGDEIIVETAKGCDIEGGVNNKRPIKRRATIAGVYPHFVLVRLENGQMESVLWKDMMGGRKVLMRKIILFPSPHVEVRIYVSDEMERDYWQCREDIRRVAETGDDQRKFKCEECSWRNVRTSEYSCACILKGLKEQMERKG